MHITTLNDVHFIAGNVDCKLSFVLFIAIVLTSQSQLRSRSLCIVFSVYLFVSVDSFPLQIYICITEQVGSHD